jgi:hypothetical protein
MLNLYQKKVTTNTFYSNQLFERLLSYKTILSITAISITAMVFFAGFEINNIIAETKAQPEKFVFVENTSTTALFKFRDGTELLPIQQFSQTAGFGIKTTSPSTQDNAKAKPSFTMEKIVGGSPYLYSAADEAQKYSTSPGFEYPYKFFEVTVFLAQGGNVLRSFEYHDCQITNYNVITRSDNEEGYTGKGFVLVDQFSFECNGYTPNNPEMEKMNQVTKADMISSNDLKNTDQWAPEFKK